MKRQPPSVRAIFDQAREIDSRDKRAAFLDRTCADAPEVRGEVEALLQAGDDAGNFLETPAGRLAGELAAGSGVDDTRTGPAPDGGDGLEFLEPSDKPGSIGRLGHYEVREVVGRGGMGVVLRAFDENLHRVIAVKVMAPQLAASATARQRFIREARAAAAVSHDHIVTIHAVEEAGGLPYIVMQYVDGISLQERLDRTGPLRLAEVLRIGMQAASGLAAAHKQGLVHRDIKPANILLENGVERVKITDFGLARAADDASLTQAGAVAGTPQYMSPEQAEGKPVDARSDLFSLGSVLYAMCTGRPPFRGSTARAVLKRVCEEAPAPVREAGPEVPDWLCAIVAKLQAKEPADRYQSAAEVAEVLGRHLAHVQHPSVVPLSAVEPAAPAKRAARHRRWAVAAAVLVLLVAGLGTTEATGVTNVRATVIRIFTSEGTLVVETDDPGVKVTVEGDGDVVITGAGPQEVRLRAGSYRLKATRDGRPVKLDRDLVAISRGDRQVVKVRLEGPAPAAAPAAPDRPPVAAQPPLAPGEVRRFVGHDGIIYGIAISPDGRQALTGGQDGTVRLWNLESGEEVHRFDARPPGASAPAGAAGERPWSVTSVAFSRDGGKALIGTYSGPARLWDVKTWQEKKRFGGHAAGLWSVAFSADGRYALTAGGDRLVCLWDLATGAQYRRFEGHKAGLWRAIFSPDERQVLSSGLDGTARLWDAKTGETVRTFDTKSGNVASIAFSPDGRRILTGDDHHGMVLWDAKSGDELRRFPGHAGWVWAVIFSRDGRRAVSGCGDQVVRLWDVESGLELARFDHGARVWSAAWCPDGRHVLSGGDDGVLRLWELPPEVAAPAKAVNGAFVLLGSKGVPERRFDTLAEAVQGASNGDTIEVRGNGPFVTPPVSIGNRALTLRAASGFRPVIRLNREGTSAGVPLFTTNSSLVLEGLELGLTDKASHTGYPSRVLAGGPSVSAANCRFYWPSNGSFNTSSRTCRFRNCEFVTGVSSGVLWQYSNDGDLAIDNCLQADGGLIALSYWPTKAACPQVRVAHSTVRAQVVLTMFVEPETLPVKAVPAALIRLAISESVIDVNHPLSLVPTPGREAQLGKLAERIDSVLPQLLAWRDLQNLYAEDNFASFVILYANEHIRLPSLRTLADWDKTWGQRKTESFRGRVRYHGGDPLARQMTSDDFRLRPDSAGYGAGKDGKDLGADVDLVGSGPAYERWKKTPDYQTWLKETGQIKK